MLPFKPINGCRLNKVREVGPDRHPPVFTKWKSFVNSEVFIEISALSHGWQNISVPQSEGSRIAEGRLVQVGALPSDKGVHVPAATILELLESSGGSLDRISGIDCRRRRRNSHSLGGRAHPQNKIYRGCLPCKDLNINLCLLLKSGLSHRHRVAADRKKVDIIETRAGGGG